ncbi:MAG: antirestriction protein ArdA [Pseudomonadota bacterium]
MTQLYAQPYDIAATGFYFESANDYAAKAETNRNEYGDPVEEYEIQFIDGEALDCALAQAWGVNQANVGAFLEACDLWDDDQKTRFIIAVGECGYDHGQVASDPDQIDITFYQDISMRELAEQFVDEGLFGEIPERLQAYLDYDAIARDLAVDYAETVIAGTPFLFHCA